MFSANFKSKRTGAASRGFLVTALLSCLNTKCSEASVLWVVGSLISLYCEVTVEYASVIISKIGQFIQLTYEFMKMVAYFSGPPDISYLFNVAYSCMIQNRKLSRSSAK